MLMKSTRFLLPKGVFVRLCHYLSLTAPEIETRLPSLPPTEIPSALFQLSKKSPKWDAASDLEKLTPFIPTFKPRDIFYLFFVCKRARVRDDFWEALCSRAGTCAFSAFDLSGILSSIAQRASQPLQPCEITLVKYLLDGLERQAFALDGQGIANVLSSLAKIEMGTEEDNNRLKEVAEKVCAEVKGKIREINVQGISNILSALARFQSQDKELVRLLVEQAKQGEEFSPRHITNILHALARLDVYDYELVYLLTAVAETKLFFFKPQDIINTLSALATFDAKDQRFINLLLDELQGKIAQCNPQDIAQSIKLLAKLKISDHTLLAQLTEAAMKKSAQFNEKDKDVTRTSLSKFGMYNAELEKLLTSQPEDIDVAFMNATEVSENLVAQASLGTAMSGNIVAELVEKARTEAGRFNSTEFAHTLDALSRIFLHDEILLKRLIGRSKSLAPQLNAHELGLVLRALLVFENYCTSSVLMRLVKYSRVHIHAFAPNGLVCVLRSLAKYDKKDVRLIALVKECAELRADSFTPKDIADYFSTLVLLVPEPRKLAFPNVIEAAKKKSAEFTPEQVALTLESLATLKVHDLSLIDALKPNRMRKKKKKQPTLEDSDNASDLDDNTTSTTISTTTSTTSRARTAATGKMKGKSPFIMPRKSSKARKPPEAWKTRSVRKAARVARRNKPSSDTATYGSVVIDPPDNVVSTVAPKPREVKRPPPETSKPPLAPRDEEAERAKQAQKLARAKWKIQQLAKRQAMNMTTTITPAHRNTNMVWQR